MTMFTYTEPYIAKDKSNKKWWIAYSVKYKGEIKAEPRKEYGKAYKLPIPLNKIANEKDKRKEAERLMRLISDDLADGIDIKYPNKVKEIIQVQIKESLKYSYNDSVADYFQSLGFSNPKPNQLTSIKWRTYFFKNQFQKFVDEKGLQKDIRQIKKTDLIEFLDSYYKNPVESKRWSNNTYNDKRTLLFGFFNAMLKTDMIDENPVTKIPTKRRVATERFTKFTKEERDIIFDYFDKEDKAIAMMLRITYYAYIRDTEFLRLKINDIDFEKKRIRIFAENAKGQRDNIVRFVQMAPQLIEAIQTYLSDYTYEPEMYIVGKKKKPSYLDLKSNWKRLYNIGFKILKKRYPNLFKSSGLTPYSFKHSGVTDFVNDNSNGTMPLAKIYRIVQSQCRHQKFETTEKYLKSLEIYDDEFSQYIFD